MAQTGKTPILLYGSTTATNQPSAGNLTNSSDGCEIAINVADKNLFFKDSTNTVNTVPIRQSSASSDGWLSSTDWSTFNSKQPAGTYVTSVSGTSPISSSGGTTPTISLGTVTVANGGTGLTSWTSGGIVYASGTGTLASGTALQFNGKVQGIGAAPSTWYTTYNGAQINTVGTLISNSDFFSIGNNVLTDAAASELFLTSAYGLRYRQVASSGKHEWYSTAASGTAGNTASLNLLATLFPSGGMSLGNTTDPGAANLSVSGNVVIATSGKGIDFSATAGTGTSELLADYEEGTWTPSVSASSGTITTVGAVSGSYTKVGNNVTIWFSVAITNNGTGSGLLLITSLPYAANGTGASLLGYGREVNNTNKQISITAYGSATTINCAFYDGTYPANSGNIIQGSVTYFV